MRIVEREEKRGSVPPGTLDISLQRLQNLAGRLAGRVENSIDFLSFGRASDEDDARFDLLELRFRPLIAEVRAWAFLAPERAVGMQ